MAGYARAIIVGNVGNDPEFFKFQSGDEKASFRMATSEQWTDKNGEKRERTTWHNIAVTNQGLIKVIRQYVAKGSRILVEGSIQTREYEKNGEKRYATEIALTPFDAKLLLLSSKDGDGGSRSGGEQRGGSGGQSSSRPSGSSATPSGGGYAADLDDDIPFEFSWR